MDQNSGNYEKTETLSDKQHVFIENQNNCPLCDSQLEIKVIQHDEVSEIKEEAYCPICKIKTRDKIHTLQ